MLTIAAMRLVCSDPALAYSPCQTPCLETQDWQAVNRLQLHIASQSVPPVEDESFDGDWRFEISGGGVLDFRVDVGMRAGRERHAGTMLILSGRVLAVRGLVIEGSAWENLEGHVLMLRLTRQLLGRAFPGGPKVVGSRRSAISLRDDHRGFRAGGDDYMDIFPPWSLSESVDNPAAGRVKFEMQLAYGTDRPRFRSAE